MDIAFENMRNEAYEWAKNREKKFLEDWCKEAGVKNPVGYDFDYDSGFTIYTTRPGYLISRGGQLIEKYTERLNKEFGFPSTNKILKIKFVEIKGGFANY